MPEKWQVMNPATPPTASEAAELHTHLFANLVMQQAGMTMIFLGVTPHPETGKTMFDLEAAQHFISQLEMLEAKTRGNLSTDEIALLKQSLTTVRMAFVQAVERGVPAGAEPLRSAMAEASPGPAPELSPPPAVEAGGESGPAPAGGDDRKKFVKKY